MNPDNSKQRLTCFKYCSGATALRCLAEGTLYFARPNELNDTLEAKFDHADPEKFLRVFEHTLSEISQQRGGPTLSYDMETLAEMSEVIASENERLHTFCDNIGIFSAAQRPNHQAMWAYYADNCKGVCFELVWPPSVVEKHQLWAVDVTYSHQARVHNWAEDWRNAFLELAAEHPDVTYAQLFQMSLEEVALRKWGIYTATRAVSIKHTDWAHEKEIRFIAPAAGARLVLADVLKRVHFIRTDGAQWAEIIQQLFKNYPTVELAHWQFHHGTISAIGREMEFSIVPFVVPFEHLSVSDDRRPLA